MLSFSTEFPVAIDDVKAFSDLVTQWVAGSPHSAIAKEQLADLSSTGSWTVQGAGESLSALVIRRDELQVGAFRYLKAEEGLSWCTETVYSFDEFGPWVSIRTSRESEQPQLVLPSAKKPQLVKTVLEKAGGGLDGEVFVRDVPLVVASNDVPMAARLINGDSDNYLPVVYISRSFEGSVLVNSDALARTLGGLAHVLVESDPSIASALQALTSARNAYDGAVGVYWPSGEHYRYLPGGDYASEYDLRQTLAGRLRASLTNRRPMARCTWSRAEAEAARDIIASLRAQGSQDVDAFTSAFDAEIKDLRNQLAEAEKEIWTLKVSKQGSAPKSDGILLSQNHEHDFYDHEAKSIILEELSRSINNVQSDSRRQHIIEDILNSNIQAGILGARRETLKEVLRNYTSMGTDEKRSLERMGFSIREEGKHIKIVFMDDSRYTFTLAKSGSDYRGGLNAASDIGKRLF